MTLPLTQRRMTVDEYHQLADEGIIAGDDRVELIDGQIIGITPIGQRHAACVRRFIHWFSRELGDTVQVDAQNPVRLDQQSEPRPDIVLLRPRADFYAAAHPNPTDVLLIVEVADTTLELDRRIKVPLYARNGIPEVWLANLEGDNLMIYREPSPSGYRLTSTVRRGERLSPLAFPDCVLAVSDLLGAPTKTLE